MPTKKNLQLAAPWVEIETTQKDWDEADPKLLKTMLTQLHLIRAFEEKALDFSGQRLVNGPLHSSICLLYTSPSPRDRQKSRMPSSA